MRVFQGGGALHPTYSETILSLFTSGGGPPRGYPETYSELADFLNRQWITVEVSSYAFTPAPAPGAPDRQAFREAFWGLGVRRTAD